MIGVVAQRLIGKKCDNYSNHLDEHSCNRCNNGYDGRIVINEILYLNEEVKNILKKNELGEKVKKEINLLLITDILWIIFYNLLIFIDSKIY